MFESLKTAKVVEIADAGSHGETGYALRIGRRQKGAPYSAVEQAYVRGLADAHNRKRAERLPRLRKALGAGVGVIALTGLGATVAGYASSDHESSSNTTTTGVPTAESTTAHPARPEPTLDPHVTVLYPKYHLSPVRLTLQPKPHQRHHVSPAGTEPEAPPSTTYVLPEQTYTPPPAPPPPPHLTIRHLNEH